MENKTAVNWFNDEILIHLNFDQRLYLKKIFEQAKPMHKEELKKFFSIGWTTRERFDDIVPDIIYPEGLDYEEKQEYAFEQYYNKVYGN